MLIFGHISVLVVVLIAVVQIEKRVLSDRLSDGQNTPVSLVHIIMLGGGTSDTKKLVD